MARHTPRLQKGRITHQGPNWRGDYFVPRLHTDGSVVRAHKSVVLGSREVMTENEAWRKLQTIIVKETPVRPDAQITLEWFITNRYIPAKRARWRDSTYETNVGIIQNQIIKCLGRLPINSIDKFTLQNHINFLKERGLSYSIIQHTVSFLKDIFAEMLDQDYIEKSPAARLLIPKMDTPVDSKDGVSKPFLNLEQMRNLLQALPNIKKPDRLLCALCGVMALRPGEALALQWQNITESGLCISKRVYRGKLGLPKSQASTATLPLPPLIREALEKWKSECRDSSPFAYIFSTKNGTPMNAGNYLRRFLSTMGTTDNGSPITWQVLRRSAATNIFNFEAGAKELQAILRHSSTSDFSTRQYQQAMYKNVLSVLEKYSEAVMKDLPARSEYEIPVEQPELGTCQGTQLVQAGV
jgi:integrase